MNHSGCTAANGCAANTAAYLVKTVAPFLVSGENLYKTVGNGACFNCHGDKGTGGTSGPICSYVHGQDCTVDLLLSFDETKSSVLKMSLKGSVGTPKLCTDTNPAGANCADYVSLYLKAPGWKRNRQ